MKIFFLKRLDMQQILKKTNNYDTKEFCLNFSIMNFDPIYLAYLS